jgi:hypothetical protein
MSSSTRIFLVCGALYGLPFLGLLVALPFEPASTDDAFGIITLLAAGTGIGTALMAIGALASHRYLKDAP